MKSTFGFIDPGAIMGVVVSLIVLGVGVFAFFVTVSQTRESQGFSHDPGDSSVWDYQNMSTNKQIALNASLNQSSLGTSVFNIIGIVLIIGAIMSIVGLVYNYVR